ncbi:MAG TPA: PIN domain-containing protein, partial [Anaerolineae bacterium]|nr:PIN domain-containing protein [Anaerolineae bacterium]
MSSPDLFFDSSALFAGIVSASGASRALLLLAEAGHLAITVSEQVVVETERAIARKIPRALPEVREAIRATGLRIVRDPSLEEIEAHADMIAHRADVPILVAAMQVKTDYLVTLNRRHFMADPDVARRSGLRIGTPG